MQTSRNKTTILKEFPKGTTAEKEPYYPVFDEQTNQIVAKYREKTTREPRTIFVGRLAEYKYYNMDIVVARALEVFGGRLK